MDGPQALSIGNQPPAERSPTVVFAMRSGFLLGNCLVMTGTCHECKQPLVEIDNGARASPAA